MPPFGYPPTCPYHHEIEISKLKRKIRLLSETSDAKDTLMKEMAEALEEIVRCLSHGLQDSRASIAAKDILQKYHEQIGEQE